MTVYVDSRYATGTLLQVSDEARSTAPLDMVYTHEEFDEKVSMQDVYTTVDGDRFDTLAYRYTGDSTLWWVIAEANNYFGFPLFLKPGTRLRIPSSEVFQLAAVGARAVNG